MSYGWVATALSRQNWKPGLSWSYLQPGSFFSLSAYHINVWIEMAMVILLVLFVFPNCSLCSGDNHWEEMSRILSWIWYRFFQLRLEKFSMNSSGIPYGRLKGPLFHWQWGLNNLMYVTAHLNSNLLSSQHLHFLPVVQTFPAFCCSAKSFCDFKSDDLSMLSYNKTLHSDFKLQLLY